MKKLIWVIVGLLVIVSGFYLAKVTDSGKNLEPEIISSEKNTSFIDRNLGIYIEIFDQEMNVEYVENTTLLDTETFFSTFTEPISMINGGYFLPDYSHAGYYYHDSNIIVENSVDDKQLSGYVKIDKIVELSDNFDLLEKSGTIFQTGPFIVKNNSIQNKHIDTSINGNTLHRRSLIGTTTDNRFFIVGTTKAYDLKKLSEIIIKLDIFSTTEIDLINLDGGSSVSFLSKDNIKIGEKKKLPFFIVVF